MALVKMVEQVQQSLAEIMAPIVEYQLTIIESLKEQYPKTFLKFKEFVQELMKMWNEYIKSHLRNVAPNIFNTPFYPVYENASARSVDLVDANHSNSPPKHLSLIFHQKKFMTSTKMLMKRFIIKRKKQDDKREFNVLLSKAS